MSRHCGRSGCHSPSHPAAWILLQATASLSNSVSVSRCSSFGLAFRRNSVGTWPRMGLFFWRPLIHWLRVAWSPWLVIHIAKTEPSSTGHKRHKHCVTPQPEICNSWIFMIFDNIWGQWWVSHCPPLLQWWQKNHINPEHQGTTAPSDGLSINTHSRPRQSPPHPQGHALDPGQSAGDSPDTSLGHRAPPPGENRIAKAGLYTDKHLKNFPRMSSW